MALDGLHPVVLREASISIHYERDMLGDWTLPEGANKEITELVEGPFGGRGGQGPFAKSRHGGGGGASMAVCGHAVQESTKVSLGRRVSGTNGLGLRRYYNLAISATECQEKNEYPQAYAIEATGIRGW